MTDNQRACIAAIVASLIHKKTVSSVYSYDLGKYVSVSVQVNDTSVSVFDYSRSCHITGNGARGNYSLFDYGTSRHITFKIDEKKFNGYDYDCNSHYSGSINGNSVSIYDYNDSQYHNYSC